MVGRSLLEQTTTTRRAPSSTRRRVFHTGRRPRRLVVGRPLRPLFGRRLRGGGGSGESSPREGALPPISIVFSVSVATQTSSERGEEVGPKFPRRRSSTQLLDEALINGIPGERDVRAAQVEESEFLSQEGWKEGVGFVFPGRALCLGGGDKLSPDEMVPKGDFHIQVFVKDLMTLFGGR